MMSHSCLSRDLGVSTSVVSRSISFHFRASQCLCSSRLIWSASSFSRSSSIAMRSWFTRPNIFCLKICALRIAMSTPSVRARPRHKRMLRSSLAARFAAALAITAMLPSPPLPKPKPPPPLPNPNPPPLPALSFARMASTSSLAEPALAPPGSASPPESSSSAPKYFFDVACGDARKPLARWKNDRFGVIGALFARNSVLLLPCCVSDAGLPFAPPAATAASFLAAVARSLIAAFRIS
mmetsp:Transcript_3461/g.12569  ORF Transcript_3461/g.12569 Transcript_3461/m.12569 type:complete len:238 (-) Transcript_3461:715-1428(-)